MACVLIVDDDADASEAVARYLERAGHRAVQAGNGRRALAALATASPDVVLLDLLMPEMDGIGFLKVLHGYFRGRFLPVVVLSALTDGPQLRRAAELGVKRFFRKGDYNLADLVVCVNELTLPASPGSDGKLGDLSPLPPTKIAIN